MTWKKWKETIDNIIKKAGYTEEVEVDYIDVGYPSGEDSFNLHEDDGCIGFY